MIKRNLLLGRSVYQSHLWQLCVIEVNSKDVLETLSFISKATAPLHWVNDRHKFDLVGLDSLLDSLLEHLNCFGISLCLSNTLGV